MPRRQIGTQEGSGVGECPHLYSCSKQALTPLATSGVVFNLHGCSYSYHSLHRSHSITLLCLLHRQLSFTLWLQADQHWRLPSTYMFHFHNN
jgi:hypothetical protein